MKFGTQVALIGNFKVNISIFEKNSIWSPIFAVFRFFLNYDLQYIGKYLTNFNEIWYTSITYRELSIFWKKSNITANFAVSVIFKITILSSQKVLNQFLMRFGTHIALIGSFYSECLNF